MAEQQLVEFLDALLTQPPAPDCLLALLEQARPPMCYVEEELARRYQNKPLILADDEAAVFGRVVGVWKKMSQAYALCARLVEPDAGNPDYAELVATILHRCLYYSGMVILEHFRARRELPPGAWRRLHRYYSAAEQWGVTTTPVEDALEHGTQETHCAAAYVTLLLVDLASPYRSSFREMNLIRHWAGMWAGLVSIHPMGREQAACPYVIELEKDLALHPGKQLAVPGSDARRLDTLQLSQQIQHMLHQLRERITPSQLGLGEETTGQVIQLLNRLIRPWAQTESPRKFRRFAAKGTARVASGFDAMHFFVTGKEFVQPDAALAYSRKELEQLFTFRDRIETSQVVSAQSKTNFPIDEWAAIDQSANGFRLMRSNAGHKIMHSQLVLISPHDGEYFLLAQIAWLMEKSDASVIVGVATLPGLPTGIGVRLAADKSADSKRYVRAFQLPALPAIKEESSIVMPFGVYQPGRILEVSSGSETWLVKMHHILQRGADFDRISYLPV